MESESSLNDHKAFIPPTVGILMATYNGSKWINDQIDSIFRQAGVDPTLYVLDDYSTDDTLSQLRKWQSRGFKVILIEKPPRKLGVPSAYFYLMDFSYSESFLAFADQDDVWNENHLSESIKALRSKSVAMTFSPREYIDSAGKSIGISPRLNRPASVSNAIIENIVYGNTLVMTSEFLSLSSTFRPNYPVMHDSWLYLWASVFGEVIPHENVGVRYRLHEDNFVGVKPYKRFGKAVTSMRNFVLQDLEFINTFNSLNEPGLAVIREFIGALKSKSPARRLKYCLGVNCYRQGKVDNFLFNCVLLFAPRILYRHQSNPWR